MKSTFNEKLIAYLALVSGLAISTVAIYYSVAGLIAIYPTAIIPIVAMGVTIELGKLAITLWLKQNWNLKTGFIKFYAVPAIIILMLITSTGVFGFLSKAHSDQTLVSGDVQSKIAVYDEKIKTAKENIESDRKQLSQMDEAVDQIMARSTSEGGADKANAIRRSQQRDRSALSRDIETNQKLIVSLNDEATPIRAEVRKVDAEVGPIKYIASFLFGANPDANLLERAVNWVTVLIVIVLDPLALVLLLASQYSFQRIREQKEDDTFNLGPTEYIPDPEEEKFYQSIRDLDTDVGEKPTAEELEEGNSPLEPEFVIDDQKPTVAKFVEYGEHPKDTFEHESTISTLDKDVEKSIPPITYNFEGEEHEPDYGYLQSWNKMLLEAEKAVQKEPIVENTSSYVQNEEQISPETRWKEISNISQDQYQAIAKEHQIVNFAQKIVAGLMTINDVGADLREQVSIQVEKQKKDNQDRNDTLIEGIARQVNLGVLTIDQIPDNFKEQVQTKLNVK